MVMVPGFIAHVASVGIKDDSRDFAVVVAPEGATCAAMMTRSRFVGPSILLCREALASGGGPRGVVVVSKNANVANGRVGRADAAELRASVAERYGLAPTDMLVASTGVIGRPYPMDRLRQHIGAMPLDDCDDLTDVAEAIMTTDTVAKLIERRVGDARIVGLAKGVGMIEPNMATLLTFFFTDAAIRTDVLEAMFRRVVDRSFNALSIDTDTSTSDTAAVFASGVAGDVDVAEFERALGEVAHELVMMIAADGEGASRVIVVTVSGAHDEVQARRVGKSIVNSPLVKTAVHGADPNWGRVAMAIGKCEDDAEIDQDRVTIAIGGVALYPEEVVEPDALERAAAAMREPVVEIDVDLGIGSGEFTVYGCDLTDGYVRINADYTT